MIASKRDRAAVISKRGQMAVENRQRTVRLARRALEEFLRRVQDELGLAEASVTIRMVSDAEIARMNEKFRKKKGPTDVLSFPAAAARRPRRAAWEGEPDKKKKAGGYLGDIAISPATARRYAKARGRRLPGELRVLMLHGILHLLGYDHETDRGQMERVERKLRTRFGLA